MAEPNQAPAASPDEKIVLPRRVVEKLIKELFMAKDKGWTVDLKAEDGLPKMLVMVVDKLLTAVRDELYSKNTQITALGHANVRALFVSEALTRLNEIDETGKQSAETKKKLYCDALNEIRCAASARIAVLFFVDGRGLITELYCQGFSDDTRYQSQDYIPMLAALSPAFAANDCQPLIINEVSELIRSIYLPLGHPDINNFLATPITFNNNKQVRGVLYFANKTIGDKFDANLPSPIRFHRRVRNSSGHSLFV